MRFILSLLFSSFIIGMAPAQTLNGKIILGPAITDPALGGVKVEVLNYTSSISDSETGAFQLSLPDLRPGMKVPLDIIKPGYAVINREATQPYLPDNPLERVYIHMASVAQRDEMALQFYRITVERNIQVNFDAAAEKFAQEANYEAIARLYVEKETALKLVDSLAARLARFDPGLATKELVQAMQLHVEGRIMEAFEVLDCEKILARIQDQRDRIDEINETIRQEIQSLMIGAEMAISSFNFDLATEYFLSAINSDSTNVANLTTFANFLHEQNEGGKAVKYYRKALKQLPNRLSYESQIIQIRLGISLASISQYDSSLKILENAKARLDSIAGPTSQDAEQDLAWVYGSIGVVYERTNNFEKALLMHNAAKLKWEALAEKAPFQFGADFANTLSNIGVVYIRSFHADSALTVFEKADSILRLLVEHDPEEYTPIHARFLINLGNVYGDASLYDSALNRFWEAEPILLELSDKNPRLFLPELGRNYLSLGNTYSLKKEPDLALSALQKSRSIREYLAEENPIRFKPDLALTLFSLGDVYANILQHDSALKAFRKAESILIPLAKQNPNSYGPRLASVYSTMSEPYYYIAEYDSGLRVCNQAMEILLPLAEENFKQFAPDIAIALNNKGNIFDAMNHFDSALQCYHASENIWRSMSGPPSVKTVINIILPLYNKAELYWRWFLATADSTHLINGFATTQSIDTALIMLPNIPFRDLVTGSNKELKESFLSADLREIDLLIPTRSLKDSVRQVDLVGDKVLLQKRLIMVIEKALMAYPDAPSLPDSLEKELGILAKWQIINGDFEASQISAERCLRIDDNSKAGVRWLPLAILLQGKFMKAKKLYNQNANLIWSDKDSVTFRKKYLADLDKLEAANITHPDFAKIRTLLTQ